MSSNPAFQHRNQDFFAIGICALFLACASVVSTVMDILRAVLRVRARGQRYAEIRESRVIKEWEPGRKHECPKSSA